MKCTRRISLALVSKENHAWWLSKPSEVWSIYPFCDFLVDLTLFTTTGLFNANDMQQILQEVVKMKDFKHPHVMPLIGVCLDSGVGVVMPFMANSSVLSYLKKERDALLLSEDADIEQVL